MNTKVHFNIKNKFTYYCLILFLSFYSFEICLGMDLKTKEGKIYHDVQITSKKPNGLHFIHSGGTKFLKFVDLPITIQQQFNYNQAMAIKYEEKKHKHRVKLRKIKEHRAAKKAAQIAKVKKIKEDIYKNGTVLVFTVNKVYGLDGRLFLNIYPGVGSICIGTARHMIFKGHTYSVRKNVKPAELVINDLKFLIKQQAESILSLKDSIADYDTKATAIRSNISSIYDNPTYSTYYNYDEFGYYNEWTQNDGITSSQRSQIRYLKSQSRKLRVLSSKATVQLSMLKKEVIINNENYSNYLYKLESFDKCQDKFKITQNNEEHDESTTKMEKKSLAAKISVINELYKNDVISKEIHDSQVLILLSK